MLLIFARRFSTFFRSGFLRYRRVLLLVAAVTALFIAGFTRFTAFTVLTRFTVIALAIVTAFTALFTLAAFRAIATVATLTALFTAGALTALTATILTTVLTVAFRLRRFGRFGFFDGRLFFTGEQVLQTTEQAAQEARFSGGRRCGFSLGGCSDRFGNGDGFFSRRRHIGGQGEGSQGRLLRTLAFHRRIFQRTLHVFFVQFRQQVAEGRGFLALAHAQHRVVRGLHFIVRHDDGFHATLTFFDRADGFALFVQQVRSDLNRHDSVNFFGVFLQRFFFDQAQDGQRQRFVVADGTGAVTAWAHVVAGLTQRRAEALA